MNTSHQFRAAILAAACIAQPIGFVSSKTAPSIERVATLRAARSVHTATTLTSGSVLIAGGMNGSNASIATAELFDPATNRVQPVASMNEARSGHTATLLADGRVLIIGGYNGSYMRSVEIFDPATRRFSPGGSLREGRSGHTATLLPSGLVLVIGGVGSGWTFLRGAELLDPATGRSTDAGLMTSERESHTATLLVDGRVLVTGGHRGRRAQMEVHATAELFDPASRRFEVIARLGTPRHKHDAIRLRDGRVLIVGGADRTDRNYFASTEIYDPRTRGFVSGPEMANSRYKIVGTSALLSNGDVLITSGARTAELLDGQRLTFREIAGRFPDAYHFATAAALPNGDVMITGGYAQSDDATDGVWRFRR